MKYLLLFCLMLRFYTLLGQGFEVGKLKEQLRQSGETKQRADLLAKLAYHFTNIDVDTAIQLAEASIALSKKLEYRAGEGSGLTSLGRAYMHFGNNDVALDKLKEAANLLEELKEDSRLGVALVNISLIYAYIQQSQKSFEYVKRALQLGEKVHDEELKIISWLKLCDSYSVRNADSVLLLARLAEKQCLVSKDSVSLARALIYLGIALEQTGAIPDQVTYRRNSLLIDQATGNNRGAAQNYLFFSRYYEGKNIDSALISAKKGYELAGRHKFAFIAKDLLASLSKLYELKKDPVQALAYYKLFYQATTEFFSQEKTQGIRNVELKEQKQAEEEARTRKEYRNRILQLALGGGLLAFLLVAIILYRNNKQKQRTNLKLAQTLEYLKNTQVQLIQSEKMASLGELTAGIAHEIQNPLNFVNNFSEVNTELIDELDEQLAIGNMQQAKKISENIKANEAKIMVHGKRADAIVKSMLQHSRTSSSKKELVDINSLADEYLRLSYHGLRAKDSSFQAKFETSFDPEAGKIIIVPQEIGRVLLNLLNNAFYAVMERKKQSAGVYDPIVKVSTRKLNEEIEISIADNGLGIPPEITGKIFQPFFTTKPTGQGTGLGLSLSYDIVKSHQGELRVETKKGEGSVFTIVLPSE